MSVPLRAKNSDLLFSSTVRISERSKTPLSVSQEEEPSKRFSKNSFGVISRTTASLLAGFFLFNPFLDVYADELPLIPLPANETVALTATSTPSELVVASSSPESEVSSEPETIAVAMDEQPVATTVEQINKGTEETKERETTTIADGIFATSTPMAEAINTTSDDERQATTSAEQQATTTDELSMFNDGGNAANTDAVARASSTPEVVENNSGTSSEAVIEEEELEINEEPEASNTKAGKGESLPQTQIVSVIEHKYLFKGNECIRLDDGAFYCAPPDTASSTNISNLLLPRVYVESDVKNKKSKEIFFEDENEKVQITANDTDDDAPAYDKQSGLIVWHSLVKGRFQIMLYDRNSSTTRQLTLANYNNTDAKIRGKSLVWQGWVNNNWEIFYIKDASLNPPMIEQITANEQPDMFPIISDDFITWQSFFDGSWHVSVYNIQNGQISQISQPEAGKYENPRFALLFENRKENGEMETVGYDVVSGKEIPINAPHTPSPAPSSQEEKDHAVPVPSGQTGTSTSPLKNPGKDDEGHES